MLKCGKKSGQGPSEIRGCVWEHWHTESGVDIQVPIGADATWPCLQLKAAQGMFCQTNSVQLLQTFVQATHACAETAGQYDARDL